MYKDEDMKLPASFLPRHPFDNGMLDIRDEKLAPFPRTEQVVRKHLADYYAMHHAHRRPDRPHSRRVGKIRQARKHHHCL